jgi:hypothetical protein
MILDLVARFANWRADRWMALAKADRAQAHWWEDIARWCEVGGRMRMEDIRRMRGRRA